MTPAEQLAEAILSAAGSGLRHYTASNRERIIAAAERFTAQLDRADELLGTYALLYGDITRPDTGRNIHGLHAIGGRDE